MNIKINTKLQVHYVIGKWNSNLTLIYKLNVSIFKSNTKTNINGKQQSGSFTFLGDIKPDIV